MYYKELLQNLLKKGLSKQKSFSRRFAGYSLSQNRLKNCAFCVCFPDEISSWFSLCVFGSKALRISGHSKAAQTKNVCAAVWIKRQLLSIMHPDSDSPEAQITGHRYRAWLTALHANPARRFFPHQAPES